MLPRPRHITTSAYDKRSIRAPARLLQIRMEQGAMACHSDEEQHQLLEFLKREQVLVVERPEYPKTCYRLFCKHGYSMLLQITTLRTPLVGTTPCARDAAHTATRCRNCTESDLVHTRFSCTDLDKSCLHTVLPTFMSTRFGEVPRGRDIVSRLEQVLRAGLTIAGRDDDERNVRQRADAGPSPVEFAVTVAFAKIGSLAEGNPQLRVAYGVSTNLRWGRTLQEPWREIATVTYDRLPARLETSLGAIVSLAKDAIMYEYRNDYIALHARLESALLSEPTRLPQHRDVIIAQPESLEAFLCLRNAIKRPANGSPRFLAIPADNGSGTAEQNEKLLHMYLLMGEVVTALVNGRWHSQGTVPVSMAEHILTLQVELGLDTADTADAVDGPPIQMGGQRPDYSF